MQFSAIIPQDIRTTASPTFAGLTLTNLTVTNDILLSSGSILNFNSGDVTITHSTDKLTLAGGQYQFTGNIGVNLPPVDYAATRSYLPYTGSTTGYAGMYQVNYGSGTGAASVTALLSQILIEDEVERNISHLIALDSRVYVTPVDTIMDITDVIGIYSYLGFGSDFEGDIGTVYGIRCDFIDDISGTVTDAYGIYVGVISTGTNKYGIALASDDAGGGAIWFGAGNDSKIYFDGSNFHIDCDAQSASANLILDNLPTASAGLPSGAVWNDSGTLKIA